MFQFPRASYVDYLMECCISKEQFWFRQNVSADESGISMAVGTKYFISNITLLHSTPPKKLFITTKNSSCVKLLSGEAFYSKSKLEIIPIDFSQRFFRDISFFGGVIMNCCIALFMTESSTISKDVDVISVRIFAVEETSRVGIYLTYFAPACIIQKLSWLQFGAVISIEYPEVRRYDDIHDIIEIGKGDRTSIKQCQSDAFVPVEVMNDECARFSSIIESKLSYNSIIRPGAIETCARQILKGAFIIVPIELLHLSKEEVELTAVSADGNEFILLVNLKDHISFLTNQHDQRHLCPKPQSFSDFEKVVRCSMLYQESMTAVWTSATFTDAHHGDFSIAFRVIQLMHIV